MSSPMLEGLSSRVLTTLPPPSASENNQPIEATNLKTMGSFNWVDHEIPTIVIPGHPTRWKCPKPPIQLNRELSRPFFNEENARKCGYPLGSYIRAIQVTQESLGVTDFDLSKEHVDVVINRNGLRKLLSFASSGTQARGRSSSSRHSRFRIDAQLAPNERTMVLTRYEIPTRDTGTRSGFVGLDHHFERTTTEDHAPLAATDMLGNHFTLQRVGYHRIVRYDLLGMRFLVQSRVDASDQAVDSDIESLATALKGTHLDHSSPPEVHSANISIIHVDGSNLRHVQLGHCVPQEELMDIKTTRSGKVKWGDTYPQFFLSQTPKLVVATGTQDGATVTQIRTHTRETLQTEHNQHSGQIRTLVTVLGQMRKIMQDHGKGSPLAFVWDQTREMKVYKIERPGVYMSDEGIDQS